MTNQRAGARLLAARTLLDRGLALDDDESLARARDAYLALGIIRRAEQARCFLDAARPKRLHAGADVDRSSGNAFTPAGEVWTITFGNVTASVRDSKGVRDIARLIAHPGREILALDLAAPAGSKIPRGDLGEVIDAQARAQYKQRLVDLEAELEDADNTGDAERSARVQAERDALLDELSSAYRIGGKPRRAGDPAERARTAVTGRIRDAIKRIEAAHPELGRHLNRSIRTGTYCAYDPDPPSSWTT